MADFARKFHSYFLNFVFTNYYGVTHQRTRNAPISNQSNSQKPKQIEQSITFSNYKQFTSLPIKKIAAHKRRPVSLKRNQSRSDRRYNFEAHLVNLPSIDNTHTQPQTVPDTRSLLRGRKRYYARVRFSFCFNTRIFIAFELSMRKRDRFTGAVNVRR